MQNFLIWASARFNLFVRGSEQPEQRVKQSGHSDSNLFSSLSNNGSSLPAEINKSIRETLFRGANRYVIY